MKIVIATDKFKECLTSEEVGEAIQNGIHKVLPDSETVIVPIADGGDGTMKALTNYLKGQTVSVCATSPSGETITAHYGVIDSNTAVIDVASASGLSLIDSSKADPMKATSKGTGELILDALGKGYKNIILGVGGSATNDAGIGILSALGYEFKDTDGKKLLPKAENLYKIRQIEHNGASPLLHDAHISVLCDVDANFYGKNGATLLFSRQKGASRSTMELLEKGMQNFAHVLYEFTGTRVQDLKYAGAAGGISGSLYAILGAELKNGITTYLDLIDFAGIIKEAELIITGEGKMDKQTLLGKAPYGVCEAAKKNNCETVAIVGTLEDEALLKNSDFSEIITLKDGMTTLEECMNPENAKKLIMEKTSAFIRSKYLNKIKS